MKAVIGIFILAGAIAGINNIALRKEREQYRAANAKLFSLLMKEAESNQVVCGKACHDQEKEAN